MARGSIDRRDNGRYRARHEGTDGRWHSRTFDRRVDAERWLSDQVSRTSHGTWIDPNAGLISLEEYSEAWLAAKSRLKPKTRQGYLSLLRSRILPELGDEEALHHRPCPDRKLGQHNDPRWPVTLPDSPGPPVSGCDPRTGSR